MVASICIEIIKKATDNPVVITCRWICGVCLAAMVCMRRPLALFPAADSPTPVAVQRSEIRTNDLACFLLRVRPCLLLGIPFTAVAHCNHGTSREKPCATFGRELSSFLRGTASRWPRSLGNASPAMREIICLEDTKWPMRGPDVCCKQRVRYTLPCTLHHGHTMTRMLNPSAI